MQSASFYILRFHMIYVDKEHWEPVIANILVSAKDIEECWALDFQSHGESALLNARELTNFSPCKRFNTYVSETADNPHPLAISDWARGVAGFVETHLRDKRIVLIGHSAGTSAASVIPYTLQSDVPFTFFLGCSQRSVTALTPLLTSASYWLNHQ